MAFNFGKVKKKIVKNETDDKTARAAHTAEVLRVEIGVVDPRPRPDLSVVCHVACPFDLAPRKLLRTISPLLELKKEERKRDSASAKPRSRK